MNSDHFKLRSGAARAAHLNGASPRFSRPAIITTVAMLLLSACSASMDMQGTDPRDYYAQHPIENKVGANGELISPNCPDWKMSPVTTYSNTKQGNIGCATTTNLGLMLEDPRDLERGASGGHVAPDTARSSQAIQNYRSETASATPSVTTTTTSDQ